MAGKKHKHRHRQQQQGKPDVLLNELSSLRDLLGTDDLGDIPLLDQVAEPAPVDSPHQTRPPVRQPVQEPLDESDLPVLFSPVDEELPEDISPELNEADRALLRPLQDLPSSPDTGKTVTVEQTPRPQQAEQQTDLFDPPAPKPAENPFLPAHIRARLTGGRVPRDPDPADTLAEPGHQQLEPAPPAPRTIETEQEEEAAVAEALRELEQQVTGGQAAEPGEDRAEQSSSGDRERDPQRQKLVDRLVASQLPELERQLRARIELMLDELEAKR
ncbi:hypothetical protein [Microbulbifer guangxiensis]|uniref:hypothetical protein n=1 Tax=Microbulbifer guangxiensis TaxID=2904249 RepID=UPI001F4867A7|nr:hypothetical protein [Microbulbifer guangxiensis]